MHRPRPSVCVATLAITLASLPAGAGARDVDPAAAAVARVRALASPATEAAAQMRAAAAQGLHAVVAASLARSRRAARPLRLTPLDAATRAGIDSLPPALRAPVGELATVVTSASASVRRATAGLRLEDAARALNSLFAEPIGQERIEAGTGFAEASGAIARADARLRSRETTVRAATAPALAAIDRATIAGAALAIAGALDRALPALRAGARAAAPHATELLGGCSLVPLPPVLCVGGAGNDVYTVESTLVIDLGGDDRYLNSAGGANPLAISALLPVSVNVDLGGNDRYERTTASPPAGGAAPAQGGGFAGVGMLVDVAGNDSYRTEVAPATSAEPSVSRADAQGLGVLGGVGLIADLGGDDRYEIDTDAAREHDRVGAYGQGIGGIGDGIQIDLGAGDDAYLIVGGRAGVAPAGPGAELEWSGATRDIEGQGNGTFGGTGLLLDDGGRGRVEIGAVTFASETFDTYGDFDLAVAPTAIVYAQGFAAFGGTGLLLGGRGDTFYAARASASGLGSHQVFAQGVAHPASLGLLDDSGGDDEYLLSTSMSVHYVDIGPGGATAIASGLRGLTTQDLGGQGHARLYGALGALVDHGGNDRYQSLYTSVMGVYAYASAEGAPATAKTDGFAAGPMWVQGTSLSGGAGVLLDEAGHDRYEATIGTETYAMAIAGAGGVADDLAVATWLQPTLVAAQGATIYDIDTGTLADLGGADRYEATGRTVAHSLPREEYGIEQGGMALFQGSGPNALLIDRDGGEADTFASEPNFEDTCTGYRGEPDGWVECPVGSDRPGPLGALPMRAQGMGFVDSAPAKSAPAVAFDPSQAASGPPDSFLAVAGALNDAAGAPLSHRFIQVRLQIRWLAGGSDGTLPGSDFWVDLTAKHAFTGADGTWSVDLYLPNYDREAFPWPLRLWVFTSGDTAMRGASDALTFNFAS